MQVEILGKDVLKKAIHSIICSPAIVVYTLHSIVMVLSYYIYLLGTYHWILSLILSVHFRNLMHL